MINRQRRLRRPVLAGVQLPQGRVEAEHRVRRALDHAGHVGRHVGHGLQVLAVEIRAGGHALHGDEFRERHERRRGIPLVPQLQREQVLGAAPRRRGQLEHDRHVLALGGGVEEPDRLPAGGQLEGSRDVVRADAVQRRLGPVDHVAHPRLRVLDVPVDVDHARGLAHQPLHLAREGGPALRIRSVDLGHHRLEHGGAGRHLGDGHRGAVFTGNGGDGGSDPLGDRVTLVRALLLRHEVHLDVGDVGAAAQVIVAHEAVEIERRRRTGVNLPVAHLGVLAERGGHLLRDARRLLQRRALRSVDDHLELRLVVEG